MRYQKEALCKIHNSIFEGHHATLKNHVLVLLARHLPRCKNACANLPYLSTAKTVDNEAHTIVATTHSRTSELEDPC